MAEAPPPYRLITSAGLLHRAHPIVRAFARLPLPLLRPLLRAGYHRMTAARGIRVRVGDRTLRFEPGTEPVLDVTSVVQAIDAAMMRAFTEAVKPGDLVVDLGAHGGKFALVGAALAGAGGTVVAIEPGTAALRLLERNRQRNRLQDRIRVEPVAIGAVDGVVWFLEAGVDQSNTIVGAAGQAGARTVTMRSLDSLFPAHERQPAVIKIDVEGAEFAALRGGERLVRGQAIIFCELHPYAWTDAGHSGEELRDWLLERGRTMFDLVSGEEVEGFQYGAVELRCVS